MIPFDLEFGIILWLNSALKMSWFTFTNLGSIHHPWISGSFKCGAMDKSSIPIENFQYKASSRRPYGHRKLWTRRRAKTLAKVQEYHHSHVVTGIFNVLIQDYGTALQLS